MDTLKDQKFIKLIDLLRDARKQKGWSQKMLADKIGINQSIIAKAEILERRIDVVELFHWLEVLECEPCHIFSAAGFVSEEQITSLVIRPALNYHESKIIVSFIEQIPYCAYLVDTKSQKIINANGHACRFYGYTADELKDLPLVTISLQPDQELLLTQKSVSSKNEPLLFRHRKVDKTIRIVALSAILAVQDSDHPLICFIARDVSGEIQQELEMQTKKANVQNLMDRVPYGIFIKDLEGRYVAANEVFAQTIDTPLNRIMHASDHDLFDQSTAQLQLDEDLHILTTGQPLHGRLLISSGKNQNVILELFKIPLFDDEKKINGIMGSFYPDIAHSAKLSEIQFTARFRGIFKNLPIAVYIASYENGLILEANDAFIALSNLERNQVIGYTSVEIGLMTPDLRAGIVEQLKNSRFAQVDWEKGIQTNWKIKGKLNFQRTTCDSQEFVLVSVSEEHHLAFDQYRPDSDVTQEKEKLSGIAD